MTIDEIRICNVVRAFWRRIEPHKHEYGPNLPIPLPVEFHAHMTTALLALRDESEYQQLQTAKRLLCSLNLQNTELFDAEFIDECRKLLDA